MNRFRDPVVLGGWLTGVAALVLYTITMAPGVAFWDVGEFITTSITMGVPHPPGAPTFVLLGRLFTLLPLPLNQAATVNYISVLGSTIAAVLLYLIILEMLRLWGEGSGKEPGAWVQAVAACTGALAYAFSSSAWFNAVEAEVYGLSMTVTALCLWLALRHVDRVRSRPGNITLLIVIGYALGLGAGNHLLALLTIPSILILLWYLDRGSLTRVDMWVWSILFFALGYSIYILLYIRSGLNPPIDMNNPENLDNFVQFLQRRQYGSESMLATMFDRRAPLSWQVDYQFLRYFRTQFILPFYALAFVGALVNLYQDKRTFFANAALWVIMGFGLVVYLNMPDPQPRDRDYIFVGCYFATAIWIGLGTAGVADYLSRAIARLKGRIAGSAARIAAVAVTLLGFGLLIWQTAGFYHSHDRTGDVIPWDYAYNILQTCEQDAILFTNGDNDTYPLWYLQIIEGIRRDVRIVNLSLLNTDWYIKELRDREPKVPIEMSDQRIATQLGFQQVQQDTTLNLAGLAWRLRRGQILRIQDVMTAHIIQANQWRKPVYFAITVPRENQANLEPFARLDGFAFRVIPDTLRVDVERATRNLKEVFQYRGILDPRVYKDDNSANLLLNYGYVIIQIAQEIILQGKPEEAWQLIQWARDRVPFESPDSQWFLVLAAHAAGDTEAVVEIAERFLAQSAPVVGLRTQMFALLIYEYASAGRWEQAATTVERWLEVAPSDEDTRSWLTDLRAERMPERLAELGRSLERILLP